MDRAVGHDGPGQDGAREFHHSTAPYSDLRAAEVGPTEVGPAKVGPN